MTTTQDSHYRRGTDGEQTKPFAYLKSVLETLVTDFPASRMDELLPWNWKAAAVNG